MFEFSPVAEGARGKENGKWFLQGGKRFDVAFPVFAFFSPSSNRIAKGANDKFDHQPPNAIRSPFFLFPTERYLAQRTFSPTSRPLCSQFGCQNKQCSGVTVPTSRGGGLLHFVTPISYQSSLSRRGMCVAIGSRTIHHVVITHATLGPFTPRNSGSPNWVKRVER